MKLNRTLLFIFFIAGMIPPLVFRLLHWYNGELLSNWAEFSQSLLSSIITTVIISCGVVSVLNWLQQHYPWRKGVFKRLLLEISGTIVTAFTLIIILTVLFHLIAPKENLQAAIFSNLIVALIMNFVLVAITEGIFFFQQWKHTAIEAERFKKERALAQFESLKNQVNPHFLFNSLTTLSGLINHDKELSKEFLENLSTVYRYVLQHKDEEIVTLKTEMDFIFAFSQLLKKRHGERIAFHFNVVDTDLHKGIPPMTLQLLVENAVKHNIASRKNPLKIEVFSIGEKLVVRNNLQRKKAITSTRVGLENIKKRYQYLSDQPVEIVENNHFFEVKVPIIKIT